MWRNWFLIAVRALAANRLFTVLNIVGLAVGMAACTLMALWVGSETRHDAWVPDAERVFMLQSRTQYAGKAMERWRHSPAPLLPAMQADYSAQIEAASRVMLGRRALRLQDRVDNQLLLLADPGFFDVLPWPVLAGSTAGALAQPRQLVVTETFVRKWFAGQAPVAVLGQVMQMTIRGEPKPYRIVAVLKDPPAASIFEFEAVVLLDINDSPNPQQLQSWGAFNSWSLVRLRQASDAQTLRADADAFIDRHVKDFSSADKGFYLRPEPVPLQRVHLSPLNSGGPGKPPGDATLVGAVAAIALLVLLIATITYINLATARVSLRSREVGLRKTLGASRAQLVTQFLVESSVLAAIAGLLALALVELALPAFNALLGQKLVLSYLGPSGVLWPVLAMVAFVGIAGGWYPALVMARQQPRQALAGQAAAAGGGGVRAALVVGQFAIAVTLISGMAVIYAQVLHLRNADMGYQPEGLAIVQALTRTEVKPRQQALLDSFLRVPGVTSATRSMFDPTGAGISRQPAHFPGVPEAQSPQFSTQPVDWDYAKTYGARLIAGRDLQRDLGGDDTNKLTPQELSARGVNVLVNRAALPLFGSSNAQVAIGKSFQLGPDGDRFTATVVGVLEDIRLRSARDAPEPAFFARDEDHLGSIAVRFDASVPAGQRLPRLEAAWRAMFPDTPFMAELASDAVARYYQAEERAGHLFALFAGLAIALCAVGVYGLAVFTAERRTKEIGLRKLMGASVADILRLMLWRFSVPVLWSLLLAWPLAWWLARGWLDGFSSRIALSPWPFLAAALLALGIAWATVAAQALKVARASPIAALRHV